MTDYTEADVERLADVLSEAQKRGIKHGSYTLARWILTAWQVEGSTPIASPAAPEACCVDTEQGPDAHGTLLHTLGCRNRCGVDTTWYPPTSPLQGAPYPCGTTLGHEGDHWAPPALRTPMAAGEPVPVPPPVDALLKLVDEFGREAHAYGLGDDSFGDTMTDSWKEINSRVRALWAAGVEEGRQQLEHAEKLAALHGYELGVAEGRRQATEERTEERTATLTEAYWKLRQHAEDLRLTFVYTNAQERAKEATEAAREGLATGSDGRWREKALGLRSHARGIEAGARDLAHLLGVEEHEIEQPVRRG